MTLHNFFKELLEETNCSDTPSLVLDNAVTPDFVLLETVRKGLAKKNGRTIVRHHSQPVLRTHDNFYHPLSLNPTRWEAEVCSENKNNNNQLDGHSSDPQLVVPTRDWSGDRWCVSRTHSDSSVLRAPKRSHDSPLISNESKSIISIPQNISSLTMPRRPQPIVNYRDVTPQRPQLLRRKQRQQKQERRQQQQPSQQQQQHTSEQPAEMEITWRRTRNIARRRNFQNKKVPPTLLEEEETPFTCSLSDESKNKAIQWQRDEEKCEDKHSSKLSSNQAPNNTDSKQKQFIMLFDLFSNLIGMLYWLTQRSCIAKASLQQAAQTGYMLLCDTILEKTTGTAYDGLSTVTAETADPTNVVLPVSQSHWTNYTDIIGQRGGYRRGDASGQTLADSGGSKTSKSIIVL